MEVPKPEIATAPAAGGRGRDLPTLRQQIEIKDPHIQASVFFLGCGGSVMLHGNGAANPEHLLAGYALFTVGATLAFHTLSGAGRLGRAAARVEAAVRRYFQ
ncbi:unnamed protein product [Urochloa decumbens]|uniref:Uncharacterized protein n=1 Tax=Urochloa decumbens TaxID=240449 RepID=A0ABC9E474_9POAL